MARLDLIGRDNGAGLSRDMDLLAQARGPFGQAAAMRQPGGADLV